MKVFNAIFAIVFLSFTALQFNDPDPYLWAPIYGAMVAVCVMAFRGKVYKNFLLTLALFYVVYLVILAPSAWTLLSSNDRSLVFDDIAKMQNIYVEETREFLGLIICLAVLAVNYMARKKYPSE
jgi:hypothetical protein